ncbi:somatostatin receptor type 4-like [Antedon mediterranea]|uniref:somatostatin receptor type 4-like n=1 Tax=Antedon mediterranea TaxID=105859 RepID=UPI003AFA0003
MINGNDTNTIIASRPTSGTINNERDHGWLITLRFVVVGFGILLNVGVSAVFFYIKMYKKSLLHGLIFQQSIVDLLGCCTFLFFYNQDAPDGRAGRVFCKARALNWFITYTSIYNLVMITVERYIAVVHPLTYRNRNIGRKSGLFYTIPYIIGFLISFHLAIIADANKELPGECHYNESSKAVSVLSGLLHFLLIFFLPAGFMIFCYSRILSKIHRKSQENKQHTSSRKQPYVSIKRNLVFTMLIVVIAFIITTAPNFIMYLIYNICHCFAFSTIIEHEFTVLLSTCNMCINPIIYGAKMDNFRSGVRKIWRQILYLGLHGVGDESTAVNTSQNISKTSV